jgi:hypothetical protein
MVERRINKCIEVYLTEFKENIKQKSAELGIKNDALIQYIYDYNRLSLSTEEFIKRKRVKNVVPFFDRCCAKRANFEQCTRKKKNGCEYCGTHMKGTPHGIMDDVDDNNGEVKQVTQKVEVWAQDILGIIYYVDKNYNVYQAEDIVSNKPNPKIIAKYVRNGEQYSIPEFGI